MAAATVGLPYVTVEEYLRSTYEPDVDYVDGVLEERSVGEYDHGDLQGQIVTILRNHAGEWKIRAVTETRVQVSATRFRVPDVCVVSASSPREQIIQTAPTLCIEVLSPEDRFVRSVKKFEDYIAMGVREVWIFDPGSRTAHVLDASGRTVAYRQGSLRLEGTSIELQLSEVFATLDDVRTE